MKKRKLRVGRIILALVVFLLLAFAIAFTAKYIVKKFKNNF